MMFRTHRWPFAFTPLLAAIALVTACDDDPVEPPEEDPADAVELVRLTIGTDTLDLADGATENITIPLGATDVTTAYFDADTVEVGGLDDFELLIEPAEGDEDIVTFERSTSDPFAGVLNGESAGVADDVNVQLFHVEEQHSDFDVFLNITVQ